MLAFLHRLAVLVDELGRKDHDPPPRLALRLALRTDPETDEPIQLPNFRVDVVPEGRDKNSKPGCGGAFVSVLFEGVLEVSNPALFKTGAANGIGSGKAFGFGLLSFAPI